MIRSAALLLGVVTDASALLLSVNSQYYTVQIEDQSRADLRQTKQLAPQSVVQAHQLPNCLRFDAVQKTTQGRRVRKRIQTQQRKERTIVLQNLGFADPPKSRDQDVEHRQEQVGWLEVSTSVGDSQVSLQQPPKAEASTKTLDQHQPTEVSQVGVLERKLQCSQAFSHRKQGWIAVLRRPAISSLKVNILPKPKHRVESLARRDFFGLCSRFQRFSKVKWVKKVNSVN